MSHTLIEQNMITIGFLADYPNYATLVVFKIKNWIGGMIISDPQIQFVQDIFTLIGHATEGMESHT